MRPYPLLAVLLLTACQPSPPPAPPPEAVAPAPAPTPTPDPTDKAIDNFLVILNQADPNGALISDVGPAGQKGSIALRVTDDWRLLPEASRESNAQDLYNIWLDEWTKLGGSRSLAMVFLVDRNGNSVGKVTSAGVDLEP